MKKTSTAPSVFQKLNLKAQNEIVVFNVPSSFEPELQRLDGVKILRIQDLQAESAGEEARRRAVRLGFRHAAS